jgi:hypothetical protein
MRSYVIAVCSVTIAVSSFAQKPCEVNFVHGGSFLKGYSFSTNADVNAIDAATALQRIEAALAKPYFRVLARDPEHGTLHAESSWIPGMSHAPGENARFYPIEFVVRSIPGGVNLSVAAKLLGGMGSNAVDQKNILCGAVDAASKVPVSRPEASPSSDDTRAKPAEVVRVPIFSNADVLKMSDAGLPEEIIIAKIADVPDAHFDVSTDALVELNKKKVSTSVVKAMLHREKDGGGARGAASTAGDRRAEAQHDTIGTYPADQMKADLLRQGTIQVDFFYSIRLHGLSDIIEIRVLNARETATASEYDIALTLGPGTYQHNTLPHPVTMMLLYVKRGTDWELSDISKIKTPDVRK